MLTVAGAGMATSSATNFESHAATYPIGRFSIPPYMCPNSISEDAHVAAKYIGCVYSQGHTKGDGSEARKWVTGRVASERVTVRTAQVDDGFKYGCSISVSMNNWFCTRVKPPSR